MVNSELETLRTKYLEVCERLETVNQTNRLKQMTIIELQKQRDELRAKCGAYENALEGYASQGPIVGGVARLVLEKWK